MNLRSIEAKAFVPAQDFERSKQFYQDLGFSVLWSTTELAHLRHGASSFLLQNYFVKEYADNFKMHLLVEAVDDWWQHIEDRRIAARYAVRAEPPADRSWGLRDCVLFDPAGVMWRIAQAPIARQE